MPSSDEVPIRHKQCSLLSTESPEVPWQVLPSLCDNKLIFFYKKIEDNCINSWFAHCRSRMEYLVINLLGIEIVL